MGSVGGKKHGKFILIYLAKQTQRAINAWEKTPQSTIKVLENTHTKNRPLKIEAVTKMGNCFTICQYRIKTL